MPNEDIKSLLGELKEVVLALHRSAGNLDSIIIDIEDKSTEPTVGDNFEFFKMCIDYQKKYRRDMKIAFYKNLDEQEEIIWQKLTEPKKN